MASTIITKKGSGVPTSGDLVHGELAVDTVNKRLYTENAGGTVIEVGVNPTSITTGTITASGEITANGGIALGDNDKATFGDSDDLQIYHDGSNSYIQDEGAGGLIITSNGPAVYIQKGATETSAEFNTDGAVKLRYDNATKFETTATGIDVTGTVTADGLTVDGESDLNATVTISHANPRIKLIENDSVNANTQFSNDSGDFAISTMNDAESTFTKRFNLDHATGDISFYEDTGTTAKFFWDSSAESLGIGTSNPSPSYSLDAAKGIRSSGVAPNFTLQETDASNQTWLMGSYAGTFAVRDTTVSGTTYPFKIEAATPTSTLYLDSSGNVGIGTSSPSGYRLNVSKGSAGNIAQLTDGVANTFIVRSDANTLYAGNANNYPVAFVTNNAERMRIDSSGNLLVGKTALNGNTAGFQVEPAGAIAVTRSGSVTAYFNRQTSDGDIAVFRKDGTTVGSIGTNSGNIYLTDGARSLIVDGGVVKAGYSTGGDADNAQDLGSASVRWKDLYLSGGVYLGGTGAANKLDDYEEGTWTPSAGEWSGTYSQQDGYYTKVGNLVTCWYEIEANGGTGSFSNTWMILGGVPFTISHPPNFSTMNGHWVLLDTGNTSTNNNGVLDGLFPNYYTDTGSSDGVGNYATSLITTSNSWKMRGMLIFRT